MLFKGVQGRMFSFSLFRAYLKYFVAEEDRS